MSVAAPADHVRSVHPRHRDQRRGGRQAGAGPDEGAAGPDGLDRRQQEGNDTTDPNEYWKGGAILPLGGGISTGGYKGYGLSVMIDILAGVLSGGGFASASCASGSSGGTCHFQGALSIDGFGSVDNFKAIMDQLIAYLKATEPAEGSSGVLVHGEREVNAERERLQKGIPYHREVVGRLETFAGEVGVPLPKPVAVE